MTNYAHVTGWGMAVPERILTNEELSKMVDTNDQWIQERTGIKERRVAGADETTASLAVDASLRALDVANVEPKDIDLIIVSTSSPEHVFPSTASLVQDRIGATDCGAFDLSAACTGFIYALSLAAQSIRSGSIKTALVIGSETLSRLVNWEDRSTCILFGDGAGAFVLQQSDVEGGIMSSLLRSDGSGGDLLSVPAGGSSLPTSQNTLDSDLHYIQMNGREVFRFATRVMARATKQAASKAGYAIEDLDIIIPHQANLRIIDAAARGLKLPMDKFAVNVDRYGNTSTASIPLATVEAIEEGRIKKGDKIVMVGFGGGLTWGALALEWTGPFPATRDIDPSTYGYKIRAKARSAYRRLVRRIEGILFGSQSTTEK
jgi:3-oxoacyl-[acyl-carrier-protein] synthase-3